MTNTSPALDSIVLTGASRRIGLYTALRLQEAGHHLIVTYRNYTDGIAELKRNGALTLAVNLENKGETLALIATIKQTTSTLRAIIHNASGWLADDTDSLASEPLDTLFKIHMQAPWLMNRGLHPLLNQHKNVTDIIHITDYNALRGSEHHAAYAATKAGLESMTRSFAKLYVPKIKVNAIAPYLIVMNEDDYEMAKNNTLHSAPMGLAPGEEVIWKTIDYAMKNPYITGITLPVDGGMSLQ